MTSRFLHPFKFRGSYFRGTQPIREKHKEILHHAKISRYTVGAVVEYPHSFAQTITHLHTNTTTPANRLAQ
jgi:hypothetical protein